EIGQRPAESSRWPTAWFPLHQSRSLQAGCRRRAAQRLRHAGAGATGAAVPQRLARTYQSRDPRLPAGEWHQLEGARSRRPHRPPRHSSGQGLVRNPQRRSLRGGSSRHQPGIRLWPARCRPRHGIKGDEERKTSIMSRLPDFKLETFMSRWEFSSRYHMTASDVETLTLRELLAMAEPEDRAAWDDLRLGYIETYGTPALRQAVASTYDTLEADDILAFAGIEEGIFAAMQVLLERDDHAIILTPNYQSAETIPLSICAT